MLEKPYSEACERNRGPLLAVLRDALADCRSVLEIGSGSGQHAVYFAAELPHLTWQPSDLPALHPGIRAWLAEAQLPNLRPPLALDVAGSWPAGLFDAAFTANTLHIMSWQRVEHFFAGVARVVAPGGLLAVYGPFNYGGAFTSESNARFDRWLKSRDPASGIRDFEDVCALARSQGFDLERDLAMPANNRTLVMRRLSVDAG
jgi:cyclopropane fatty-acyl-phospholipid synthase-like methyltransferase